MPQAMPLSMCRRISHRTSCGTGIFASSAHVGSKARQNIHYSRVHVSRPWRMGVSHEISMPTLSIPTGVILPLHGLVTC